MDLSIQVGSAYRNVPRLYAGEKYAGITFSLTGTVSLSHCWHPYGGAGWRQGGETRP